MRKLVKDTLLPSDASDADLYYLLEVAATYRLDPFAKELWAIRMPGKNASAKGTLTIMVGRDGLLAIAERHPDFRGFRCQAYYSNDVVEFHADPREMPDGTFSHYSHSFKLNDDRGELKGAWAEVYRDGRPTVHFDAKIEEYVKDGDYSPWKKQRTVMIEKCALTTALRHAYRISGLYIADEMSNALLAPAAAVEKVEEGETNWGEDVGVKNRLIDLFDALGKERYTDAKIRLLLASCDDDGRLHLIEQLELECEDAEVPLPEARAEDEEVVAADETEVVEPEAKKPTGGGKQEKLPVE